MMYFQTPTIQNLIGAAVKAARQRTELLLLLSVLAGILTSIVYSPALKVLDDMVAILGTAGGNPNEIDPQAASVFSDGVSTLLFCHLAVTAVTTFLIIPWARAIAPGQLMPAGGGALAMWTRGLRSCLHVIAAGGLSILLVIAAVPIVQLLGGLLGPVGNVLTIALLCLVLWAGFALAGTANLAVAAEARDRRETLLTAFNRSRLFLAPIAGSLALIFLVLMFLNLTVGTMVVTLMPDAWEGRIASVISGAVVYSISALHVAALYTVPDFRDLRPS
jgi:vacuolar-type H+-ATPase subunit I/STV1